MPYKKVTTRHTQPTVDEVFAMQAETERLIEKFLPIPHLTEMINKKIEEIGAPEQMKIKFKDSYKTSYSTIYNWRANGRIPYHYVDLLVRIDDVQKAGFTRESLRPDVKAWHLK